MDFERSVHSRQICAKNCLKFCVSCTKRGIKSRLGLFFINFEEAILLCVNQDCVFPFGCGDISSFVVQKKSKETAFSTKSRSFLSPSNGQDSGHSLVTQRISKETTFSTEARYFLRPVHSRSNVNGQNTRHNKHRKDKVIYLNSENIPEEQRKGILHVEYNEVKNAKVESFRRMDEKHFPFSSVQKNRGFVSSWRRKAAVFAPYTPRRKYVCSSSQFSSDKDIESEGMQSHKHALVDLTQNCRELTEDEEQFLADVIFN